MRCEQIESILSDYIDSTIESEEIQSIEDHLDKCDNCRDEYVSMKNMIDELRNLECITAPHDFLYKIKDRLKKQSFFDILKDMLFPPGRFRIPMEVTAVVATACLVFVIAVSFMTDRNPNNLIKQYGSKTADYVADNRHEGSDPINLKFSLNAFEKIKPVSSRDLINVSSGSQPADINHETSAGVMENRDERQKDAIISHIDLIMSHVQGKVLSIEHGKGISHPEYITMEIPTGRYMDFIGRIESLGSFTHPAPVLYEGYPDPIVLRVQFIQSNIKKE